MGMMKLEIPHRLPLEDAKKRVEALLGYWNRKYGVKSSWAGDKVTFAGKAMGITFDGNFVLQAAKIAGEAQDPGMLLRGSAKSYLERKFGEYLNPSKTLEQVTRGED